MGPPREVILSSSGEASSSKLPGLPDRPNTSTSAIHLHDLLNFSPVHTLKPSTSAKHSLGYVRSQNGVGGGIFALQDAKAIVNMWTWQKDQIQVKLHLPEKMSCFNVSPNGIWAVGGSPTGHIYLWELASGLLHASFTAHYRAITTLTFSPDSRLLVTSSLDASVHLFLISSLVDPSITLPKPYGTLSDHTLPVRAVALSPTASVSSGRIWTCSDDGTVKVWSLHPPFNLLCTFTLPQGVSPVSLAVDPTERYFYVAGQNSTSGKGKEVEQNGGSDAKSSGSEVWRIPMFRRKGHLGEGDVEAVGGGGLGEPPIKTGPSVFSTKYLITTITLPLSSTHLLIGTEAGEIHILSLPSHQPIRTLTPHAGPITHLSTLLSPPDLSKSGTSPNSSSWVSMEVKPLERMRIGKPARDIQEITISLRASDSSFIDQLRPSINGRLLSGDSGEENRNRDAELAEMQDQNKKLRMSLDKAIGLNEKLWTQIVDQHLAKGQEAS